MNSNLAMGIGDALMGVETLAKRAKVMIEDVRQAYFDQEIEDIEKTWKIAPPYHILAGIKVGIANDLVFDMMKRLEVLRELTDEIA